METAHIIINKELHGKLKKEAIRRKMLIGGLAENLIIAGLQAEKNLRSVSRSTTN